MLVKELINRQTYWTPITICGGGTKKTFFCKDYGKTKEERLRACNEYGDCMVRYYDFSTDYDSRLWKRLYRFRGIFVKLFHWINPQRLNIQLDDDGTDVR